MASITAVKASRSLMDLRLLSRTSSTEGSFEITVDDPSNLVLFLDMTTSSTENCQIIVHASTEGEFASEDIGDFYHCTTGGNGGGQAYALAPFESARFIDVSTGRILNVSISSTTGGAGSTGANMDGALLSAVEIVPST